MLKSDTGTPGSASVQYRTVRTVQAYSNQLCVYDGQLLVFMMVSKKKKLKI
jgi:hypothetical protein